MSRTFARLSTETRADPHPTFDAVVGDDVREKREHVDDQPGGKFHNGGLHDKRFGVLHRLGKAIPRKRLRVVDDDRVTVEPHVLAVGTTIHLASVMNANRLAFFVLAYVLGFFAGHKTSQAQGVPGRAPPGSTAFLEGA